MARPKIWLAIVLCLAGGFWESLAAAAPGLSAESRYGASFNEWFVRGDAVVSASTVFNQGVRLAAWDGQNENDLSRMAVASAVYFLQVPSEAVSVRITVGYRTDPAAQNAQVAGFLFVRNQSVEPQTAPQGEPAPAAAADDNPAFAGDSYLLPANQTRQTFDLPLAGRATNGVLEVHLVAGAGQVLDVQCIQLSSFAAEVAAAPVVAMPSSNFVQDPYQDTYYYYYTGPSYYPFGGYYGGFNSFDNMVSPFYWGGWATWRACFHHQHHWRHRPNDFEHHRPIVVRPIIMVDASVDAHRRQWLRDHFHVDGHRLSDRDVTVTARNHTRVVSDDQARLARDHARTIADQVRQSADDLRVRYGDRLPDRVRAWNSDPARARQELSTTARGPVIQSASAQWRTLHGDLHSRRLDAAAPLPNLSQLPSSTLANDRRHSVQSIPNGTALNPPTPRITVGPWADVTPPRTLAPRTPQPPMAGNYPSVVHRPDGGAGTPSFTPLPSVTLPAREPRADVKTMDRHGSTPQTFVPPPPLVPQTLERRLTTTPFVPSQASVGRRYEGGAGATRFTPTVPTTLPAVQPRAEVRLAPREFTPPPVSPTPRLESTRRYQAPPPVSSAPPPSSFQPRTDTQSSSVGRSSSTDGAASSTRSGGDSTGTGRHGRH